MTAKEAAVKSGASIRALRYYEQAGLIHPVRCETNGYRDYDEAAVSRVRLIRAYRELQFSLNQICDLLNAPRAERDALLSGQIACLEEKRRQIENRIDLARAVRMLGPERFGQLDVAALDEQMNQARRRLDEDENFRHLSERFKAAGAERVEAMSEGLLDHLAAIATAGEPNVSEAIEALCRYIEENFYPCSDALLTVYARSYGGDGLLAQMLDERAGEGGAKRMRTRLEKWIEEKKR